MDRGSPLRHLNHLVQSRATKYILLIEHPRDRRYSDGIAAYFFIGDNEHEPDGGEFSPYRTLKEVKAHYETEYGFNPATWQTIPDAKPGFREDCVVPTREGTNPPTRR